MKSPVSYFFVLILVGMMGFSAAYGCGRCVYQGQEKKVYARECACDYKPTYRKYVDNACVDFCIGPHTSLNYCERVCSF